MEYCPHCLKPTEGVYCDQCGGLIKWKASAGQLPVGTILQGSDNRHYQIGAAKGQGGFGITYAAMNLQTGQRVAIKEYYPNHCANRDHSNRVMPLTGHDDEYTKGIKCFLEEAMMLSAVGALPSVVTVIEYFEANGTAYLVMEYVDGSPLHDVVSKKGHFTAQAFLPLLPALLKDLSVLHKAGIIHRDISPDNLILTDSGNLKLLDFGSARSLNNSKGMTVLLKPGFSPVEQYQSSGQGPYTDIYALASTIYYCLTGTIPPPAFDRMTKDTLQKPNSLGAGLTTEQENALLWALSVRPEDRPSSADAFASKLFPKNIKVEPPLTGKQIDDKKSSKKKLATKLLIIGLALSVVINVVMTIFAIVAYVESQDNYDRYIEKNQEIARLKTKNDKLTSQVKDLESQNKNIQSQASYINEQFTMALLDRLEERTGVWNLNLNQNLINVAAKRAEEVAAGYNSNRPNGTEWSTVFDDYGLSYDACREVRVRFEYSEWSSMMNELMVLVDDNYMLKFDDGSEYIANSIGVAIYFGEDTALALVMFADIA